MSGHLEQPQPGCCSPETKATSSAPSLPICPLWTSKESSLLLSATERLKCVLQSKAVPDLFFLKNLLCFHCWRKPEPCVWPQTGFPRADVLRAPTHTAPKGRALGGSKQLGLHQLFSHRSMKSHWTEMSFHPQQWRPCSGLWPTPSSQTRGEPGIYDKRLLPSLCFSLWHHTAWAMFQIVLKQVPASIFTGTSQPCEFWCPLHMVWIVLPRQSGELSKRGIW